MRFSVCALRVSFISAIFGTASGPANRTSQYIVLYIYTTHVLYTSHNINACRTRRYLHTTENRQQRQRRQCKHPYRIVSGYTHTPNTVTTRVPRPSVGEEENVGATEIINKTPVCLLLGSGRIYMGIYGVHICCARTYK